MSDGIHCQELCKTPLLAMLLSAAKEDEATDGPFHTDPHAFLMRTVG